MSTRRLHASPARRAPAPARRSRAVARRRRALLWLGAAAVLVVGIALLAPMLDRAVKDAVTLPLRHEDIIRQQAREKDLDPGLIAAVIYAESKFRDQTSPAGAKGLMQITPETARDIARRSGATNFRLSDLGDPQVNISYGSYQLRYLLDRYGGNKVLATAAYNAGEGNVDSWLVRARIQDRAFRVAEIPFPETRDYVHRVMAARKKYRREYASELGLRT
jgi:soluble lytic murein transglycosylase